MWKLSQVVMLLTFLVISLSKQIVGEYVTKNPRTHTCPFINTFLFCMKVITHLKYYAVSINSTLVNIVTLKGITTL
jgi:hypothetical protein